MPSPLWALHTRSGRTLAPGAARFATMDSGFLRQAEVARDRYVAFYRSVLDQHAGGPDFAAELLIRPNGSTNREPFCLLRADIVLGIAPDFRIQECRHRLRDAEPLVFSGPHGLRIEQESFSWEALRLRFAPQRFRVEQLEPWLDRWLDPGEVRPVDSHGLAGVIHGIAWEQSKSGRLQLDIDFGSAPVAALDDLLGHISGAGVRTVTVSTYDPGD